MSSPSILMQGREPGHQDRTSARTASQRPAASSGSMRAAGGQSPSRDLQPERRRRHGVHTHQQIADAVGTSREVISRTLGRLRRAGVVRTTAGYVVITNSTRLALIGRGGEDVGDGAKV